MEGTVSVYSKVGIGTTFKVLIPYKQKTIFTEDTRDMAFIKGPKDFDLVLTDMTLPGMNGLELSTYIKLINPEVPVL